MKAKERNSSLEILRLICMLGIVIMHTSGPMINYASGFNVLWIQIENGLFQAGVSIFVIISGYFGIKTTFERVLKLELKVWGYSIISGTIIYFLIDNSFLRLIKSVFPIITNKYWFLTGYMLLMLFAPFINSAIEKMEKEQYKKLLMMMLLLFFFIPTVFYFDILGSNGKNILNMLFMYLLGGYIRKYPEDNYEQGVYKKIFFVSFLLGLILNMGISILTHSVHCPMSRDCSLLIVAQALSIFMIFRNISFISITINTFAKHVMSVYILESLVRKLIEMYVFDYTVYYASIYWFVINIVIAIITVFICIIVDYIRDCILGKFEKRLINFLSTRRRI